MMPYEPSATLLYKGAPGQEQGEYPVATVQQWYQNHAILLSARFSFDKGATWESIIDLRCRNGPTYPFIAQIDGEEVEPGFGAIAAAKKILDATRADIERLEKTRDDLEKEVEEQEALLEKMREMEKQLDRLKLPKKEKYAQVDARTVKNQKN